MTPDEQRADTFLIFAKDNAKSAYAAIDPSPRDPVAVAILRAIDSIDLARLALAKRLDGPPRREMGREDFSGYRERSA